MNLHDVIRYLVRQNAPRDPLQTQQLLAAVDAHEQEYGRGPEVAPAALSGTPGAAAAGLEEAEPFNVQGDPEPSSLSPEGYRNDAPPPDEANVPAQVEDTTQAQAAEAAAPTEERAQTEGDPDNPPDQGPAPADAPPADRPVEAPGFAPTPVTPPADVAPPAPEERAQTEGEAQAAAEERARTAGDPEPAEPVEDSQATIARLEAELAQARAAAGTPPPTP